MSSRRPASLLPPPRATVVEPLDTLAATASASWVWVDGTASANLNGGTGSYLYAPSQPDNAMGVETYIGCSAVAGVSGVAYPERVYM